MGSAGTNRNSRVIYVSIKHGGFCQEAKQPSEGFDALRVMNPRTKTETTKYVRIFNFIEGYVKSIAWYDTGQRFAFRLLGYKIEVDIGESTFVIDIGANTPAFSTFAKQGEAIDFSQEVKFVAWAEADQEGKSRNAFLLKQNDIVLPFKYKKDNLQGCPLPLVNEFDGVKDYGPQKAFFKKAIDSIVIPACQVAQAERDQQADAGYDPSGYDSAGITAPPMNAPPFQAVAVVDEDDDDIPF